MATPKQIQTKFRRICLALPDAVETITWGKPHYRVAEKIFAGYGDENGVATIGFKLRKEHAAEVVKRAGFSPAPYVGKHGWVSMDANKIDNWDNVRGYVLESYCLIAPKKLVAKLESGTSPSPRASRSDSSRTTHKASTKQKEKTK